MGAKGLLIEWKLFVKKNPGFAKNSAFKSTYLQMAAFEKSCRYWAKAESQATKYAPMAEQSWRKMLDAMKAFSKSLPNGPQKEAFDAFQEQCAEMDATMLKAFEARKAYNPLAKAARTKAGAEGE